MSTSKFTGLTLQHQNLGSDIFFSVNLGSVYIPLHPYQFGSIVEIIT